MDEIIPQGLLAILDENYSLGVPTQEIIESFLDAEAEPFIVRNKNLSKEAYGDYIDDINGMHQEMGFDFIVHQSVHLASVTEALGVHLTANGMPISEARDKLGAHKVIGYSAHSLEEALDAKRQGADYIFLGAIFDTPKDHANHPILGIDILAEACRKIEVPIYAIGGIHSENLIQIKDAGAAGFSALRAVYANQEIEHNISKLGFLWQDL